MLTRWEDFAVGHAASVREAMRTMDANREGVVLVVDDESRLVGIITDGDVRRFMLAGRALDDSVTAIMGRTPVTANIGATNDDLMALMQVHRIMHVPLVDGAGRPVRVVTLRDLLLSPDESSMAVIMAGGFGRRLRPVTDEVPKPMLKVGTRPILEGIVDRLVRCGVREICIAVHYKADVIEEHFGDGSRFGARVRYIREMAPLGTAGALALLPTTPKAPLLVVNADVLTDLDVRKLLDYHRQHHAALTVATSVFSVEVPYGVVTLAGHHIIAFEEKPTASYFCNAGLYVISPELLRLVPEGHEYDMTDLLASVLREGLPVVAFPMHERWMDVGRAEELNRAREAWPDRGERWEDPPS